MNRMEQQPESRYLPHDWPHVPAVHRLVTLPLDDPMFEFTAKFADEHTREFALEIIQQQKNDLYARRAANQQRRAELLEQWPQLADEAA